MNTQICSNYPNYASGTTLRRFFLTILFLTPLLLFGQSDTLRFIPDKKSSSYLSDVLINKKLNIAVFRIHYSTGRLSNSFYYVIDLKQKKLLPTFSFKNWTYLYSSRIDNEGRLHLSKNSWIFAKTIAIDLTTGEQLKTKKSSSEKQNKNDGDNYFIDSQDLYCTSGFVYWNDLRICYNPEISGFILSKEKQ